MPLSGKKYMHTSPNDVISKDFLVLGATAIISGCWNQNCRLYRRGGLNANSACKGLSLGGAIRTGFPACETHRNWEVRLAVEFGRVLLRGACRADFSGGSIPGKIPRRKPRV